MARLKGLQQFHTLGSWGMQVTTLLAYLSMYTFSPPIHIPGQPIAWELSEDQIKHGQKWQKSIRTDIKQKLQWFKPDGEKQAKFFVTTWQTLLLILSIMGDRFGVARFWRDHRAELQTCFPPPAEALAQQAQQHQFLESLASAMSSSELLSLDALPDGTICAQLSDWDAFQHFKCEYEAAAHTDFYSHSTNPRGGMLHNYFYCSRAGKAPWDREGASCNNESTKSMKGCGCTASLRVTLHPRYAAELNVSQHKVSAMEAQSARYSTIVSVYIEPKHTGHDPEYDSQLNLTKVDGRVLAKICELAAKQHMPISAIRHESHVFARQLCSHYVCVNHESRKFFPSEGTVARIVKRVRARAQLDPQDHVAVGKYIEEEKRIHPENFWEYRPGDGPSGPHKMLLVHQTEKQRHMLQRYGGVTVGMDSTYRTNLWGLPMLIVTVVDNHGHGYPAAFAFMQTEESGQIAEVLRCLCTWNPGWSPSYCMVDKCQSEINAINEVLPTTRVLLCDFHRGLAWQRWLDHSDVPRELRTPTFNLMRFVAYAPTVNEYERAFEVLKTSRGWRPSLEKYWNQHWANCTPLWATCHRQEFHLMNTNNYAESINRVLKVKFLSPRFDRRLDSLLHTLDYEALPHYDRNYSDNNKTSALEDVLNHKRGLQGFLLDRPVPTRKLLQQEFDLGQRCVDSVLPVQGMPGFFSVAKTNDTMMEEFQSMGIPSWICAPEVWALFAPPYIVDMHVCKCTCRFFGLNCTPCKHIFGALTFSGQELGDLPQDFVSNPWMTIDYQVVTPSGAPPPRPHIATTPGPQLQLAPSATAAAAAAAAAAHQPKQQPQQPMPEAPQANQPQPQPQQSTPAAAATAATAHQPQPQQSALAATPSTHEPQAQLQHSMPAPPSEHQDPASMHRALEKRKRLHNVSFEAVQHGSSTIVDAVLGEALAQLEPHLPASSFAHNHTAANMRAANKRAMGQPMGSAVLVDGRAQAPKRRRLLAVHKPPKQPHTSRIWAPGTVRQPGRPRKEQPQSSFPPLPRPPAALARQPLSNITNTANLSPPRLRKQQQRSKPPAPRGPAPNPKLYALSHAALTHYQPLRNVRTTPLATAPTALMSRSAYFNSIAPRAQHFKQRTQPWFAARAAACTASSIPTLLGVGSSSAEASEAIGQVIKGKPGKQSSDLPCTWGELHEANGIASLQAGYSHVRQCMAHQHSFSMPPHVHVHEPGLHFACHDHPAFVSSVFQGPSAPFAIAASPDVVLVGDDGFKCLLEVKSACPFVLHADGMWDWCPWKKAVSAERCFTPEPIDVFQVLGHQQFVQHTEQKCYAIQVGGCTVESVKGCNEARWLKD